MGGGGEGGQGPQARNLTPSKPSNLKTWIPAKHLLTCHAFFGDPKPDSGQKWAVFLRRPKWRTSRIGWYSTAIIYVKVKFMWRKAPLSILSLPFTYNFLNMQLCVTPFWADIQRQDCILAWSVILSVHGADTIAEVKLLLISPFLRWSLDLWNQLLGF